MSRRARDRENARPWQSWQEQRDEEQDLEDGVIEFPDNDDEPHYKPEIAL